jgi:hypothetical protein
MPGNVRTSPVLATIHEDTFLFRVCMQINKKKAVFLLNDGFLCVIDLRTADFAIIVPHSV